ncbi:MAG: glycosyltransferase family 39 protein [Myxococcales bacterium]|nr:glycosyltransferase family 39 protein [Myxococcales bacterium]
MTDLLILAAMLGEIAVLTAGAFLAIHGEDDRVAESLCLAGLAAFAGLSCAFQLAFLAGEPRLAFAAEVVAVGVAGHRCATDRSRLRAALAAALGPLRSARASFAVLFAVWTYLFLQASLIPPHTSDALTYHLPRVLLFQQEASLFPTHFSKYHLVAFPMGGDLINHLFLRFHIDDGLASTQFLSYLALTAGVFGLARRNAGERIAVAATFVVASLPQLIGQAAVAKNNIYAALATVAALVLAERLRDRLRVGDLVLLAVALAFGLSAKTTFLAVAGPFGLCFGWVLLREHGGEAWRRCLRSGAGVFCIASIPVLVIAQAWLFAHNFSEYGNPSGPERFVAFHRNGDGLLGAFANLTRYAFQSVHLLQPVDRLAALASGTEISGALQALHERWFGSALESIGLNRNWKFSISWNPSPETSWYGPLGAFVVVPAVFAAFLATHGRRRVMLVASAATLLSAFVLFCYAVAWFPWNARMLSPLYAGAAGCVAAGLARLGAGARTCGALRAASLAILLYVCATVHPWGEWQASRLGRDPLFGAARWLPKEARRILAQPLPEGADIALVTRGDAWGYYFLLLQPQARYTFVRPFLERRNETLDLAALRARHDRVLCLTREQDFCTFGRAYGRIEGAGGPEDQR